MVNSKISTLNQLLNSYNDGNKSCVLRFFWFFFLSALSLTAPAQFISQEGRFSVDIVRGCAPLQIQLTPLDDFGDISRQYIYEENVPETNLTTYTYLNPGIFSLVQIVGIDVVPKTDTLTIEVFEAIPPGANFFVCEENQVRVEITDDFYDSYLVNFSPSEQVELDQENRTTSFTYQTSGEQTISVEGRLNDSAPNCGIVEFTTQINEFQNLGIINNVELTRGCLNEVNATIFSSLATTQFYELQFSDDGQNFSDVG